MTATHPNAAPSAVRRLLIVDDDEEFGDSLLDILEAHGLEAIVARNVDAALESLQRDHPPVALLDIRLGGQSGVDLLSRLRADDPQLVCIMMTAHIDTRTAIEALRRGAYDYIDKGSEPAELLAVIARAFEKHELQQERASAIEALRQAKESAEAANLAKSQFLATVSHELRTPLNAIIGFSEMMLKEAMGPIANEHYRSYINDVHSSGAHLLEIINDILDLSKAEAGKLELHEDTLDARAAAQSVVRLLRPRAEEAQLALDVSFDDALPLLRADERKLKQILLNLLSNAVKFTPAGGRIELAAATDAEGAVRIWVADTGIGIAPEHHDRVLQAFGQVDSSLSRRHNGTGLGLPLVKALIELHGGRLSLDSTLGVGTRIEVVFPAERSLGPTFSAA